MASRLPLRKRLFFAAVTVTVLTTTLLVVSEVGLRLAGRGPYDILNTCDRMTVEPGGRLYRPDPDLGYAHLSGSFRVTHLLGPDDRHTWTCTNDALGRRVTGPAAANDTRRALWLFGCSFTYGWSVDDADTYAWRLQERLPGYRIVNFGGCGYGTLQALIQFEAAARDETPEIAVLAYASFHDERNTFTRRRRKEVVPYEKFGPLHQPFARLGGDGALVRYAAAATYEPLPGTGRSAVLHALENAYNALEERSGKSDAVTRKLIEEFVEVCRSNKVMPVVVGLLTDDATRATVAACARAGVVAADLDVDYRTPGYNNEPYDPHPNARCHAAYAERLAGVLQGVSRGAPP